MPSVKSGEDRNSFINRCVPYIIRKEDIKDNKAASGKCNGIYTQFLKDVGRRLKK